MEQRNYLETPVNNKVDAAQIVLQALHTIYDFSDRKLEKPELDWVVKGITHYYKEDISEVTDKLFDNEKPYLAIDDNRVVFGSMGLWLLEDASLMNEDFDIKPIDIVVRNLEVNNFFRK